MTGESNEAMATRIANMSPAELDRFEQSRRSHFSASNISKLLRDIIPAEHPVSENTTTVVAGLAKLYVGDLVRLARQDADDSGPIKPHHFIAAARQLQPTPGVGHHTYPRLGGPPSFTSGELL